MRLIATRSIPHSMTAFDFTEPGGTIGRCPGNHLLLGEDGNVGRIQAVVRINDRNCSLMNVSSRTAVLLNGRQLPLLQETPLTPGDTLTIGAYTLQADTKEPTAFNTKNNAAERVQDDADAVDQDTSDIFKELLEGPGVLPVGRLVDASTLHPFELDSQAPRNHPDPLKQVRDSADTHADHRYPAQKILDTEPEHHDNHIFSNPTPSTLNHQDPLEPQRQSLIDEALAHGHSSDRRHVYR